MNTFGSQNKKVISLVVGIRRVLYDLDEVSKRNIEFKKKAEGESF